MELETVLFEFCNDKLRDGTGWYEWTFNWDRLPPGIRKPAGNCYEQNVALKKALSKDWKETASVTRRHALERFYIVDFGGVRTNSEDTLDRYFTNTDAQNIALGSRGIASWSKALSVRDAQQYAIYDARVAAALTALQIQSRVANPVRFPLLPSRNTLIANRIPMLKEWARDHRWAATPASFYEDYLKLCRTTAERLNSEVRNLDAQVYSVEMMLFAHAEALVWLALPNN
ncbi:MAG TPA: hypothetical protein VJ654_17925 [Noviherbaspirillum sp.]|nr:hypothetical protein [Noviherbaspirillum sp.]